jgi:hypothetical protein
MLPVISIRKACEYLNRPEVNNTGRGIVQMQESS